LRAFEWPPRKHSIHVVVVIPASNVSILPSLREKTEFAGELGRALAVYKVNDVIIYDDEFAEEGDADLLATLLSYLQVPPYLRKRIGPITQELRYAGLLHPLNIVTHNPLNKPPARGKLREGVVVVSWGMTAKTFIGLKNLCFTESTRELKPGERILVKIERVKPMKCREVRPEEIDEYVGYRVLRAGDDIIDAIKYFDSVIVLTSKRGESFSKHGLRKTLISEATRRRGLILLFGNNRLDFDEIVGKEKFAILKPIWRVNFIPGQGVLSVRTIEALHATLAQINTELWSRRNLSRD